MKKIKIEWLVRIIAIALGLFFIYAGGKKIFLPEILRSGGPTTVPQEFIDLIRALKSTGFYMNMVGWLQFGAGILLIIRPSMLIGALVLIPVTFNIFIIHIVLDNRIGEYIFTGLLFFANMCIIAFYIKQLLVKNKLSQKLIK